MAVNVERQVNGRRHRAPGASKASVSPTI